LLLVFTYTPDATSKSKLFALCTIDLVSKPNPIEHYVEAVLDSTRYFVIRVTDEKAGREALIGLGFRDREEAGDFRASLAKYANEVKKLEPSQT
jgi:adaptin ear-binding coat-associated protein 1/2